MEIKTPGGIMRFESLFGIITAIMWMFIFIYYDSPIGETRKMPCDVIVNDTCIETYNYAQIDYKRRIANVPLLAVLEEAGADIEWKDDIVVIMYEGKERIVDTANLDSSILLLPGGFNTREVIDNEIIIDCDSLGYFFDFDVEINYLERVVCINSIQEDVKQ